MELRRLAKEIFIMFKNETDGANQNIQDIHKKQIYHFTFKDKGVSEESVGEAFQSLLLRNLIMPSVKQAEGFFQLTSIGKNTNPDDISEKTIDAHLLNQLRQNI